MFDKTFYHKGIIEILTERSDDDISGFHKALFAINWFPDV